MANVNDNEKSAKSQCDMIAEWLNQGYSITQLDAFTMFGCFRLASRIHDLRERGMQINACKITTNTGKRVCEYVLAK
jgi:hypothetical protein